MVDINGIESLVNRYVDCWKTIRPAYTGLWEDNEGWETLQVFRNGYEIEAFSHDEICRLSTLLTRSLRAQVNRDHKILWSWCAFLSSQLTDHVTFFQDLDWSSALRALVNLQLAGWKSPPVGPEFLATREVLQGYVNTHALTLLMDRHLLAGPLAFAVLEGMLRRKNAAYVSRDGIVQTAFNVTGGYKPKYAIGERLNRINDSLRLFEQVVTSDRGRPCSELASSRREVLALYPGTLDAYDLMFSWRSESVHGAEFWMNTTPVIMNLICLLLIDEIEPSVYGSTVPRIRARLQWEGQVEATTGITAFRGIYPPDIQG